LADASGTCVLVVGPERSGTSWTGRTLAATEGAEFLGEPDHPRLDPFAARAVRGLGSHPVLSARIVKSVRIHFALDWVRERWNPTIVVCRRHPLDVVASALALNIPPGLDWLAPAARAHAMEHFGVAEPSTHDPLTSMAWRTGLLMSVLDEQVCRHPGLHVADHEHLCEAPVERMRELVTSIGLEWTPNTEDFVVEHDRPGTGFEVSRVAAEQPGKWRTRLSAEDARTAAQVIAQFPVGERYDLAM
jgi:hypothetical protein